MEGLGNASLRCHSFGTASSCTVSIDIRMFRGELGAPSPLVCATDIEPWNRHFSWLQSLVQVVPGMTEAMLCIHKCQIRILHSEVSDLMAAPGCIDALVKPSLLSWHVCNNFSRCNNCIAGGSMMQIMTQNFSSQKLYSKHSSQKMHKHWRTHTERHKMAVYEQACTSVQQPATKEI